MTSELLVDTNQLRTEVRDKYREVALAPDAEHHFHTGRRLAALLGYAPTVVDSLPDRAVESFAGVANPFSLRVIQPGEDVVDVGSGAGFDSFIAAHHVGRNGHVVGYVRHKHFGHDPAVLVGCVTLKGHRPTLPRPVRPHIPGRSNPCVLVCLGNLV